MCSGTEHVQFCASTNAAELNTTIRDQGKILPTIRVEVAPVGRPQHAQTVTSRLEAHMQSLKVINMLSFKVSVCVSVYHAMISLIYRKRRRVISVCYYMGHNV